MGDNNRNARGEKQTNTYERMMEINLAEMTFTEPESNKNDKDQLKFASVEHQDSALLKYFIKEKDSVFIRYGA